MVSQEGIEPLNGGFSKSLMARDFGFNGLIPNGLRATGECSTVYPDPLESTVVVERFGRRT